MPNSLRDLQAQFVEIETKVEELLFENTQLSKALEQLASQYTEMEKKYQDEVVKNRMLAHKEREMKLNAALAGNPEHNRLMRHHINRLIKEIDFCIAELKNSGL